MFKSAFTLIELLVVISIIGVLSTLSVVSLNSARQKSRDTRRVADIKQIQTALEMYALNRSDGLYPATSSANIMGYCLDGSETGFVSTCQSTVFMKKIPTNPLPGGADYIYDSNGISYTLTYLLEEKVGSLLPGPATATPGSIQ